jgi:L-seryl-tRNA(Ser) seleniumtransferase
MVDVRRRIPSVDSLLSSDAFAVLLRELPRDLVVAGLRVVLDARREALRTDRTAAPPDESGGAAALADSVRAWVKALADGTLRTALNATGVVLHTNLGRAPLARAAVDAIADVAAGYSTLEYDTKTGGRGSRYNHCRELLTHLTGAADALVVNNNAAAVVLVLNTLSRGLDAIISRGELVEIGGAFRIPEIMGRSGARLREVGSTNRTHLDDYRQALSTATGVLLKVHPSNFIIQGYTAEVPVAELGDLARERSITLVHDVGSGMLLPAATLGLPATEPDPARSLHDGAHVVTMSGDKLLGGPQCGIIVGRADLIEKMRGNPLCRALRVDKLTLAALTATLRLYLEPERALREIPVLRMLTMPAAALEARAGALAAACADAGVVATTSRAESAVGGGAAPAAALPATLVIVASTADATALERRLRCGDPPVIVRMLDGAVAIDLRTVPPDQDEQLLQALVAACT